MKKIVLLLILILSYFITQAQKFTNDPSFNPYDIGFGAGGGFDFDEWGETNVRAITLQKDGKILVGGWFDYYNWTERNNITRINADGSLDTSFKPFDIFGSIIYSITLQDDGKILVGGIFDSFNGTARSQIVRLNANGSLDTSFNLGTGFRGQASDMMTIALQGNEQILVGGNFTSFRSTPSNRITRLNTNGTLDTSFNPRIGFNNVVRVINIQNDEKILVGGNFTSFYGTPCNGIARLNTNGSLDKSFNSGTGFNAAVYSLILQDDGKILVGGNFTSYNGTLCNRIACLNADGTLDTAFDSGTGFSDYVYSLILQDDGKVLVGGDFYSFNETLRQGVARLNADGSLDTSFDPGTGPDYSVFSMNLQDDGKILVGGRFSFFGTINSNIVRLNVDGSLDTSFNPGTGFSGWVNLIVFQDDGKIMVGGNFSSFNGTAQSNIARLNANGSLDTAFNLYTNGSIRTMLLQDDGKILVGGGFTFFNSTSRNLIARLNADGSLDVSFDAGAGFDNGVLAIALQEDEKILAGGMFTSSTSTGRNRIARLVKLDVSISSISSTSTLCPGNNFSVKYKAIGPFNNDNIFTAQLSDANGSFSNPLNIGNLASTSSGTISAAIPTKTISGTDYRLRVIASNPEFITQEHVVSIAAGCNVLSSNEDLISTETMIVYPNPASKKATIDLGTSNRAANLTLVNTAGIKILEQSLVRVNNFLNATLDVSYLPSGIYMVIINDGSQIKTAKLVKH